MIVTWLFRPAHTSTRGWLAVARGPGADRKTRWIGSVSTVPAGTELKAPSSRQAALRAAQGPPGPAVVRAGVQCPGQGGEVHWGRRRAGWLHAVRRGHGGKVRRVAAVQEDELAPRE